MFNPFEEEILKVYGPYICKIGRSERRMMHFTLEGGRKTSMPYARWLMTQHLGRRLTQDEHVDHKNEDPLDDRLENYQILTPGENTRKSLSGRPSPFKGEERGFTHGTQYGWQKKKCQCEECGEAKLRFQEDRNSKRRNGSRGPYRKEASHGTVSCYKRGCRRPECKAANAESVRLRRLESSLSPTAEARS